jgi:uncharacterized protein YecT (DUF1311 family)
MKAKVLLLSLALTVLARCSAQKALQVVSPSQLQALIDLPLGEAIKARETYKRPLKSAYARQMELAGKDCQMESTQGQQPYNACLGKADQLADGDFAAFYNNLQMLCHDQNQLSSLQQSEIHWRAYSDSAMKAVRAAWPDGSAAPGVAGQVYLSLIRDYMRELHEIYTLNISQ